MISYRDAPADLVPKGQPSKKTGGTQTFSVLGALHRIFGIGSTVVTWAAILCAAVLFLPRAFGSTPYIILSGSMEPLIGTGSIAYIDTGDVVPEVGKVMAFSVDGSEVPVVHRLIEETDAGYVTMGDANEAADMNLLLPDHIIGTYETAIPKAGYALAAFERNLVGGTSVPVAAVFVIGLILSLHLAEFLTEWAMQDDDDSDTTCNTQA